MRDFNRRLGVLEGRGVFVTLGEMLDNLDGWPLPAGRQLNPAILLGLGVLPCAD